MRPDPSSSPGRIVALDELRGLAILAVVASHIGLVFGPDLDWARMLSVPALGVGVDLFFVISGFVIAESAMRLHREAHGEFWRAALAFWGRRVLRIALPAWATIGLIAFVQAGGIPLGAAGVDLEAATGFYANFHWAPCFAGEAGCGTPLGASHFWSLANEMQFYLAAPFLMALRPKWTASICCLALAAGVLCDRPWGGFWWTFRVDGLAAGVLLSLGAVHRLRLPQMSAALASFWLLGASILVRIWGALASGFALTATALIFGFVAASAMRTERRLEKPSTLQKLGELSFSIYLVHLPIMTGIHGIVGGGLLPGLTLPISIVAVFLSALLLERWITKPSQIFGRHFSTWICGHGRNEQQSARAAA
jgi:peptidoglycan/LPS O-acetylase OafA/YrhL